MTGGRGIRKSPSLRNANYEYPLNEFGIRLTFISILELVEHDLGLFLVLLIPMLVRMIKPS